MCSDGTEEEAELLSYQTFGSIDENCASALLHQVINAHPGVDESNIADKVIETAPLLQAIAPRDELEGMLAVQMVATHNLAMEMAKRASNRNLTHENVAKNISHVTKLTRSFIAQMDALNKHRGKGQQKMTVEHVHVNDGGQAVIGNIDKGEGKNEK